MLAQLYSRPGVFASGLKNNLLLGWGKRILKGIVNNPAVPSHNSEAMATFGLTKSHRAPLYERPHQKDYFQSLK